MDGKFLLLLCDPPTATGIAEVLFNFLKVFTLFYIFI
jgi:hypothetical protein